LAVVTDVVTLMPSWEKRLTAKDPSDTTPRLGFVSDIVHEELDDGKIRQRKPRDDISCRRNVRDALISDRLRSASSAARSRATLGICRPSIWSGATEFRIQQRSADTADDRDLALGKIPSDRLGQNTSAS
jgi:hypothetical protein